MSKRILYISLILILSSCVRKNEFFADFVEEDYIYSIIEGNKPMEVIIYKSLPLGITPDINKLPFIKDAYVEISSENESWVLAPASWRIPFFNGFIVDSITVFGYRHPQLIEFGKTYKLLVVYDDIVGEGKTYVVNKPQVINAIIDSIFNGLRYEYFIDFSFEGLQDGEVLNYYLSYFYEYVSTYTIVDINNNEVEKSDTFSISYQNYFNENFNTSAIRFGEPLRISLTDKVPLVGDKNVPYELNFTFFSFHPDVEKYNNPGRLLRLYGDVNPFVEPLMPFSNITGINGIFSSYGTSDLIKIEIFPKR